eukprot:jgi/Chrzof1/15198/Cz09g31100.t1
MYVKVTLLAVCLVVSAQLAMCQQGQYVRANVVADPTTECPVKNPTPWDPAVFQVESLLSLSNINGVSKKCTDAAQNDLIPCALDPSLNTTNGCCSTACASGMQAQISNGCLSEFLKAICTNATLQTTVGTGLLNGAVRCINFSNATCAANSTAGAGGNGTVNGTRNGAALTPAGTTATTAPAAAGTTPAAAPSPSPRSSATATSMSLSAVGMILAGAAVVFMH